MPNTRYLMSPSIFAICPNICAKEFGIIPRSSGTVRTPSMVNVLPVPVCPYAKIVPGKIESKTTTHTRATKNLNSSLSIRQAALTCCLPRTTCPARKSSCPDSQTGFSCPAHTIMHHLTTTSCGSSQPRSEHHNIPPRGDWERV